MNLTGLRAAYEKAGYTRFLATARTCQDVILAKISNSSFANRVTIKGGVLICAMSGNQRRATRDIDLDFIRYPLTKDGIERFIAELDMIDDGISLKITGMERLSQQDYSGQRMFLDVFDKRILLQTKMDIGVHTQLDISQPIIVFDLFNNAESVSLLANSPEQAFTEKISSLVKHGVAWTRYRDVFDLYYFGHRSDFDINQLQRCLVRIIVDNPSAPIDDLVSIALFAGETLSNAAMRDRIAKSKQAWVHVDTDEACDWLIEFLEAVCCE